MQISKTRISKKSIPQEKTYLIDYECLKRIKSEVFIPKIFSNMSTINHKDHFKLPITVIVNRLNQLEKKIAFDKIRNYDIFAEKINKKKLNFSQFEAASKLYNILRIKYIE